MATWPSGLPQDPLAPGFRQQKKQNKIRTPMGYGPSKVRRRTTANISNVNIQLELTAAEVVILEDFHETTLGGGVLKFDWEDKLTGNTVSYRFVTDPDYTSLRLHWAVTFQLEILP